MVCPGGAPPERTKKRRLCLQDAEKATRQTFVLPTGMAMPPQRFSLCAWRFNDYTTRL